MKRLGNAAAAVAISGVLLSAGAPLASASEGATAATTVTLGERGTNQNQENNENGENNRNEEGDRNRNNNEGGTPYENNSNFRAECADGNNVRLSVKWQGERPESFEQDGKTWFRHNNGEDYTTDSANRNGELTEQQKFEGQQAAAKKFGYTCEYAGEDSNNGGNNNHNGGNNNNNGGNNNGGRGNNGNNNGGNDNRETTTLGERGMNAETGSNTVARALFALAVISVLGGTAFAARRFFTA
ncbi:hypothetical protein [Corynebacterium sp.]|uniref:hypothetical protein n=1 Tax=Corynebacterium sp. TaxID=1720 RepID=UPI002A918AA8|nr:hypothetical protein [Corynebacterium sp.]MDY5786350.1 hypothetical protein [Corynebacterium sp.]